MPHVPDDFLDRPRALRRFDHQRQLHRRFAQCNRLLRAAVHRAIDDIGPLHQLIQPRIAIAELLARGIGNELGARTVGGVEVVVAVSHGAEVLGIGRAQKRALMMVKPPGHGRVRRILEIDNRVLIAIEQAVFKQLIRLVRHARISELGGAIQMVLIELAKEGRRRGTVEAVVVIKNPYAFSRHF